MLEGGDDFQALKWIPKATARAGSAFEQSARDEGFAEFDFKERSADKKLITTKTRPVYFPVYYVEPCAKNEVSAW